MDESQILERRIFLKKQAVGLFIDDILELQDKSSLFRLKGRLEASIKLDAYDPVLSRKLDCVVYLLEN